MNYIITGGSGFIGTHLTNLLHESAPDTPIYNLDLVAPAVDNPLATFVQTDVRNEISVPFLPTSDDVIFNFAAIHRTPGYPDKDYFETNIRGAEHVIAFAEKYGIRSVVFTSSIAPYGASEELKSEDSLPMPNTPYGISKLVAEQMFRTWQSRADNRRLLIVRPGVVFGKGENGNYTRLYFGLRDHKFLYPGRRDTVKACIYVKDLVRFMQYRLQNMSVGVELFNCTYEPAYTIEQTVDTMLRATGLDRHVFMVPSWILLPAAAVIGALGGKYALGICPARVKKLMVSTNISGRKMHDSGFQFKFTFEEALKDWFADNDNKELR